ncbi:hypothetical protein [Pseudonocardia humida]|uniref:Uncharacterized protein n=1 Tax=Pseudonocardia humida TaxID=2800819 RepID=A0ABT1A9J7_9PSEU|nr:hypothetical protein [Pseudonocardia humida]MCO1659712.1 hypothetical protein [Pseudonocardia humida]
MQRVAAGDEFPDPVGEPWLDVDHGCGEDRPDGGRARSGHDELGVDLLASGPD